MQRLAQQIAALRPELVNGDASVGELAWVWGKDFDVLHESWRHRLWWHDDELAGWGWVCLPHAVRRSDGNVNVVGTAALTWQVHPDRPELLTEILDWYDDVAGEVDRSVIIQAADDDARVRVAEHGYEFDEVAGDPVTGSWVRTNARDLADLPDPVLPKGFRFRSAEDVAPADAVLAHVDAWHPSGFTETAFDRVRQTWPYRADLHVLVEAPDGTLVATAIIWFDEETRSAEFEPVGTHREFRRQGLGRALQLHGMHAAKAAGAERMVVACRGADTRPAARNLYEGVGFREFTRDVPYVKVAR